MIHLNVPAFFILNRVSQLFSQLIFSNIYHLWPSVFCYFVCLRKIKPSQFSFLHASLYQGDLVTLKFGLSNCYAEKSEPDSVDLVDYDHVHVLYITLNSDAWSFVSLINLMTFCKLYIAMVQKWISSHSSLIESNHIYHLNYTSLT